MLFLLNDKVLDVRSLSTPLNANRLRALSFDFVLGLAAECFSERPLLHRDAPEMALKVASLLMSKAPEVNAALFVAPARGCAPELVLSKVASISVDLMADLSMRQEKNALNLLVVDGMVWKRLAA